jgi:hypothetical protein
MSAKILQFISRAEQLQRRGRASFDRWHRINNGLEPFGPHERHRIFQQHAENERKDREWAMRHAPGPDGAVVLPFSKEKLVRLKSESARVERR